MPVEPIDWKGSWTLEDYVISLFDSKQTESSEFKALLSVYGRERMTRIWEDFKSRAKQTKTKQESKNEAS